MSLLNSLEKQLLKELLDQAIDDMSNNGCSDFPVDVTTENQAAVERLIRATKSYDKEEMQDLLNDAHNEGKVYLTDFVVLQYFCDKICST